MTEDIPMRIAPRKAILLFLVCCVSACASSEDHTPPAAIPAPVTVTEQPTFRQIGFASWYGSDHQDKPTANGEQFDMSALTAAHRALPFNSIARVTNLRTGRSVKVRINDRGPYVRNRIIDLSAAAGRQLGIKGIARVKVEIFASDQRSPRVDTVERTAQP
jgi:rare lipoprotein A